jgi:MYXO-CTERM domain-containing protein
MANKSFLRTIRFSAIVVALLSVTSFAGTTLQNGNFSAGLTGWNVEFGTVTDGGGYALFEEDQFELSSTLSQVFTIPDLARELSFDLEMTSVPENGHESWPDAFLASLYDSNGKPLFANPLGVDEFYYLDNTGILDTTGTVTGNSVSLDVSSLAGQDVLLSFDLFGGNDGMFTTVGVDNVNVSVIPAPGALLLGLIGMGTFGLWRRSRKVLL